MRKYPERLRKRIVLIQIGRRAALQAGWRRDQQLGQKRPAETERYDTGDFRQHAARSRIGVARLLTGGVGSVIGQPGMWAEPDFFHGSTPADGNGTILISTVRV